MNMQRIWKLQKEDFSDAHKTAKAPSAQSAETNVILLKGFGL